jgi:hypothetical protein
MILRRYSGAYGRCVRGIGNLLFSFSQHRPPKRVNSTAPQFDGAAAASNTSAVRVRGSLGASWTALLAGIAIKEGYRQSFETTNELTG